MSAEAPPASAAEQATQLARRPRSVRELMQGPEFRSAVEAVLPRAMKPERFVRVALTAVTRNPKLLDCTRESLFRSLLDCSAYGLEPDGRRAHLVPFKNKRNNNALECQLIIDYKGLAELARRSGDVSYIHADVVYDKDQWSYSYGTDAHLRHRPNDEDRGAKRIAYYSYVRLKDGGEDFLVMSPAEVEKIRKRSKSPDEGPWATDYDEMGKKSAFRRHSKWIPLSHEVRDAIERDDEAVDVAAWDGLIEPEAEPEPEPEQPAAKGTLREEMRAQHEKLEAERKKQPQTVEAEPEKKPPESEEKW